MRGVRAEAGRESSSRGSGTQSTAPSATGGGSRGTKSTASSSSGQPKGARATEHKRKDPIVKRVTFDDDARGDNDPVPAPGDEPGEDLADQQPQREVIPAEFDDEDEEEKKPVEPETAADDPSQSAVVPAERRMIKHGVDPRSRDQRQKPIVPFGDEDDDRWGSSDFRQIVRQLNDQDEAVVRKALRRLHLRWYHATIAQMQRLLSLVGVSARTMALIPEVVDTCRICRTWARAAPSVRTTVRLSIRFNQAVQADLMFYADESGDSVSDYIILHLVDECIRWTVAVVVSDKETQTILEATTAHWIQQFEAPELLIWDGEGGMRSEEAKVWATRWNIELAIRPKDKKAWIAERHHEILRTQLHKTQSQLAADNIRVPFTMMLAEAVLAKNALLSTGQGTPYQSLYGRTPRLLPQIEDITGDARMQDDTGSDGIRHVHRLREASVGSAVTAMAERRMKLASQSRTPLAGQQLQLHNGDLVEIYRKPPTKDRPGWVGPATVVDCSELSSGKVTVRWQGRCLVVALESLRRAMTYLVWLTEALFRPTSTDAPTGSLQYLLDAAEQITSGSTLTVGYIKTAAGSWQFSNDTNKHKHLYYALLDVAANHLHLQGCLGGVLLHGRPTLSALPSEATGSLVLYWQSNHRDQMITRSFEDQREIKIQRDLETGEQWHKMYVIQFVMYSKAVVEAVRREEPDVPQLGGAGAQGSTTPASVRTPITVSDSPPESAGEGQSDVQDEPGDDLSDISSEVFWQEWLAEMASDTQSIADPSEANEHDWDVVQGLTTPPDPTYYLQPAVIGYEYLQWQVDRRPRSVCKQPEDSTHQQKLNREIQTLSSKLHEDDTDLMTAILGEDAEIVMPAWFANINGLLTRDIQWQSDDWAVFVVDRMGIKRTLIETNKTQSNLQVTDEDMRKHPEQVKAAILAELKRWVENDSFKRQPRSQAKNLLTSRYVMTWKRQTEGNIIMKCRICVRGFQDMHKDNLDRYSGTSTRWGQRAVVATAVQSKWPLASLDISQAFLKGLTFDEVQKVKGGPKRVVSMCLPRARRDIEPSGSALIRQLKGYEDFNDSLEVLEMLKGGFGLVDAPNLFTCRVDQVFKENDIKPTLADQKIYMYFDKQHKLQLLVSAHMDDFKATGQMETLKWLHSILCKHFGQDVKMDIAKEFIHTGIKHTVIDDGNTITLDQIDYAASIKPINTAQLQKLKDDLALDETYQACYLTLLGAVAWLLQTRLDIVVYVSALQRHSHHTTSLHLKRLNRLVRHIQRHPQRLVYRSLPLPVALIAIGDSAYQAPAGPSGTQSTADPLVMRGYIVALAHYDEKQHAFQLQVLEYVGGKQNHVCRGVWSAELHNQCDMADMGVILLSFLEELRRGALRAEDQRRLREAGGYAMPLHMYTDSYSIFSYLKAQHLKFPAEKGTYFHLAYLRELLEAGIVRSINWCDTRDMVADGITKGSLDRTALTDVMRGVWRLKHATEAHSEHA